MTRLHEGGTLAGNEWSEAAQLVLSELKRLDEGVRILDGKLDQAKDVQSRFEARMEGELVKAMATARDLGRLEARLEQAEKTNREKAQRLFQRLESLERAKGFYKAWAAGASFVVSLLWGLFLFWYTHVRVH